MAPGELAPRSRGEQGRRDLQTAWEGLRDPVGSDVGEGIPGRVEVLCEPVGMLGRARHERRIELGRPLF